MAAPVGRTIARRLKQRRCEASIACRTDQAGRNEVKPPTGSYRRRRLTPHIDMTPLIDTLFTLLIVFILVATFQSPVIQLTLPKAGTQDVAPTPEIMVTVDLQGQYFVGQDRVEVTRLEEALRRRIEKSREKVVTFRGDAKRAYERFV